MRIQLSESLPTARRRLLALHSAITEAAEAAGLDKRVLELVKIRASQINGCAFCTDMHTKDAREIGETQRRLDLLPAWHETELYTETERAALELTEAITRLSEHAEISDELYQRVTKVLDEQQFSVIAWAAAEINLFNRLGVTSRKPLPSE